MEERVELARGSYLWHQGDPGRVVAQLRSGKLGFEINNESVGVLYPPAVIGESALLEEEGEERPRTASAVALEDNTVVVTHTIPGLRAAFEGGDDTLSSLILRSLIAQISKNSLLVAVANPDMPLIEKTLVGLARGLAGYAPNETPSRQWPRYLADFRFLCDLRDFTDRLREKSTFVNDAELVEKASDLVKTLQAQSEVVGLMEAFIRGEREELLRS